MLVFIKNNIEKSRNLISLFYGPRYKRKDILNRFHKWRKSEVRSDSEKNSIIIDSKSGYSGARRSVHKKHKNNNLYESISAYGVGFHRHNSEIEQMIKNYTKNKFKFTFTPHLSPMFRGILTTIYVDLARGKTINNLFNELKKFYKKEKFVKIAKLNSSVSTNDVINTNNCKISICKSKYKDKAIILSSIDNLIKGGAGQAIQNMNILKNWTLKFFQ